MIDHWLPRNKSSKKHSIFHGHFLDQHCNVRSGNESMRLCFHDRRFVTVRMMVLGHWLLYPRPTTLGIACQFSLSFQACDDWAEVILKAFRKEKWAHYKTGSGAHFLFYPYLPHRCWDMSSRKEELSSCPKHRVHYKCWRRKWSVKNSSHNLW